MERENDHVGMRSLIICFHAYVWSRGKVETSTGKAYQIELFLQNKTTLLLFLSNHSTIFALNEN